MHKGSSQSLLIEGDPSPVRIINPGGRAPFLLIGDHAGNRVPQKLGALGLGDADLRRHIAWDIGVAALGERLAEALDATFISQRYSRLVIDCNRDVTAGDAIPEVSDGTAVPANLSLGTSDRAGRVEAIYVPYHAAIAAELARRDADARETVLIALHSFTPSMRGEARPWHIGVLHGGGEEDFARALLDVLSARGDLVVGDNAPYAMDGVDYTIPFHAFLIGKPYAEIEIRQDLLTGEDQIESWIEIIAHALEAARRAYHQGRRDFINASVPA